MYLFLGNVWISLFAENWKHCSKIIFKCANNDVGPSFNENFAKFYTCGPLNSV